MSATTATIVAVSDWVDDLSTLDARGCGYEAANVRCGAPPVYVLRYRDDAFVADGGAPFTADMLLCAEHTAKVRATGRPTGYATIVGEGSE